MYELSADFIDLVNNRIRSTIPHQKAVYSHIKKGRPLDAETEEDRKIAFIKRRVGVSSQVAKDIADYKDVAELNLPDNKQQRATSVQQDSDSLMGICFLDVARAASRPVARVAYPNGRPQGTGFMISPTLFLTNQHVIKVRENAADFVLDFNYEQDFRMRELTKTSYRLDADKFFLSSPENELDFSLIAIGEKISGPLELQDIGFLPLFNNDDKHVQALFVNCIEHPWGPKQIVIRENRLTAQTATTLIYNSETKIGSSGSPVFNDDWEVVALHHYGVPYRAKLDPQEAEGLPAIGNEGIRISVIVNYLNKEISNLPSEQEKALLKEALGYNFRQPSLIISPGRVESREPAIATILPATAEEQENGTITLSLRLSKPLQ